MSKRVQKVAASIAALSEQDYARLDADEKASWNEIASGIIADVDATSPHRRAIQALMLNLKSWESQEHSTVTIKHLRSHFSSAGKG